MSGTNDKYANYTTRTPYATALGPGSTFSSLTGDAGVAATISGGAGGSLAITTTTLEAQTGSFTTSGMTVPVTITDDDNVSAIVINKAAEKTSLVGWKVGGADKWGLGVDNNTDFLLYNYVVASPTLSVVDTTNKATFAGDLAVTGTLTSTVQTATAITAPQPGTLTVSGGALGSLALAQVATLDGQTGSTCILSPGAGGTIRINGLNSNVTFGTVTAGANCSAPSVIQSRYMRLGDTVSFTAQVQLTVTAGATAFDFAFTVPNTLRGTNFSTATQGAGVANTDIANVASTASGCVRSVSATKDLQVYFNSGSSIAGDQQIFISGMFEAN